MAAVGTCLDTWDGSCSHIMLQCNSGSKEDIEKWHAVYCQKLTELFDNYKGRNPDYKHKKLIIK